jgi:hypothetical protein
MEQYSKYGNRNIQSVPPPILNVNINNNYTSSLSPMSMLPTSVQTPNIPIMSNNSNINYPTNNIPYPNISYPNPNFNYIRTTSPNPPSSSVSISNSISSNIPNLSSISSCPNPTLNNSNAPHNLQFKQQPTSSAFRNSITNNTTSQQPSSSPVFSQPSQLPEQPLQSQPSQSQPSQS